MLAVYPPHSLPNAFLVCYLRPGRHFNHPFRDTNFRAPSPPLPTSLASVGTRCAVEVEFAVLLAKSRTSCSVIHISATQPALLYFADVTLFLRSLLQPHLAAMSTGCTFAVCRPASSKYLLHLRTSAISLFCFESCRFVRATRFAALHLRRHLVRQRPPMGLRLRSAQQRRRRLQLALVTNSTWCSISVAARDRQHNAN